MEELLQLKNLALKLLEKYERAHRTIICEYSSEIIEEFKKLDKEVSLYKNKIESLYNEIVGNYPIAALNEQEKEK